MENGISNLTDGKPQATKPALVDWLPLVLLDVFVLFFNSLICLAFLSSKRLHRKSANVLLFNQSVADFVNGVAFVPMWVLEQFQNHAIVPVTPFIVGYIVFTSDLSLLALAVDRYLLITKPFLHRSWVDVDMLPKYIALIWIVPLLVTLIPLAWWFEESKKMKAKANNIYLGTLWLLLVFFTVTMFLVYASIVRNIKQFLRRRHQRAASTSTSHSDNEQYRLSQQEFKVVRLFGGLLLFFSLAYLPILYINFMVIIGHEELIHPMVDRFSVYSYMLNSLVNPILCIIMKDDYRKRIKYLPIINMFTGRRRGSFYDMNHSTTRAVPIKYSFKTTPPKIRRNSESVKLSTCKGQKFEVTRLDTYRGRSKIV